MPEINDHNGGNLRCADCLELGHVASDCLRKPSRKDALYAALAKAQAEFPVIPKNRRAKAGSFSYAYADISDVLSTVTPVLTKHGLCLTQPVFTETDGSTWLATTLHGHGQSDTWMLKLQPANNPREFGGILTYMRRYSACALLGVQPDEDVDGTPDEQERHETRPASVPRGKVLTDPPSVPEPKPEPVAATTSSPPKGTVLWGVNRSKLIRSLTSDELETYLNFLGGGMKAEGKTIETTSPEVRAQYQEVHAELVGRAK